MCLDSLWCRILKLHDQRGEKWKEVILHGGSISKGNLIHFLHLFHLCTFYEFEAIILFRHFLFLPPDKCPATRVLPSQLNPSSTVINHLLLGRTSRGGGRGGSTAPPWHSQSSPTRRRSDTTSTGSSGRGGSPWRDQVRIHRTNLAQARAQLGFGESEEGEDEGEEGEVQEGGGEAESERKTENDNSDDEEVPPSPGPPSACAEVAQVVVQLDSLELGDQPESREPDSAPKIPLLPPPPPTSSSSSGRHKKEPNTEAIAAVDWTPPPPCSTDQTTPPPSTQTPPTTCASSQTPPSFTHHLTSSPSLPTISSSRPTIPPSPSTPAFQPLQQQQQHVFSPFPSVKQPRRSAAARNLGLYGPTSRTPTVHFPQLSRNLNRSSGVGTAGRR